MPQRHKERILETLRTFARFEDEGPPVVSLYLDARWGDGRRREATRLFVKNKLKQIELLGGDSIPPEHVRSLRADIERLRDAVEEMLRPGQPHEARGVATFASTGRDLWEQVVTPRAFENRLVVRNVPYLLPLARLVDDWSSALLCQVDSRSARIVEFALGGLGEETTVHSEVPGRHHQGGWSQMRYQRHVDWLREKHLREVADVFARLADRDPEARLFVAGPPEPRAVLLGCLPPRIAARRPVEIGLEGDSDLPAIARAVLEGIARRERREEALRVEETIAEALAGGLAASGPAEVVAAANRGAIAELLIHDGWTVSGWRCDCSMLLGAGLSPGRCPACERGTAPCDLGERLVEKVYASGGRVEVVRDDARLREVGGVAARLRFGV